MKRLTTMEKRAKAFCDMIAEDGKHHNSGITFSAEWKRSSTWGYCPSISNYRGEKMAYASGWGYDKESAVLVELLRWLVPDGLHSSGAGLNSLIRELAEHGWTLEHTYNGKTEDGYKISKTV